MSKKSVLITVCLIVAAVMLILWLRTIFSPSPSPESSSSMETISPTAETQTYADADLENLLELQGKGLPEFRPLLQYCQEEFPEYTNFPVPELLAAYLQHHDLKTMWNNLHLETEEGEIFRVRTFVDQGGEGPVTRLAVYKEDMEGFPQILELPPEEKINPSEQVLDHYRSLGEVIHQEKAMVLELEEAEYFFETHNNELVRLDITGNDGVINCQFPVEELQEGQEGGP